MNNEEQSQTLYQDVLRNKGLKHQVALYFRSEKITYPKLLLRIDKMAYFLSQLGIKKGDVVTLLSPNVPETIVTFYALNKIGATICILHPLLPITALERSLKETGSLYFILLDARLKDYGPLLKDFPSLKTYFISAIPDLNPIEKSVFKKKNKDILDKILPSQMLDSTRTVSKKWIASVPTNTDYLKPSVYLLSGGTTGRSKTILLNDKALRFPGYHAEEILGKKMDKTTSMIGLLPLFHGFGLAMGIHAPLMNGASSFLMLKYDGKTIVRGIKKKQISILITVPYLAKKLLATKGFKGKKLQNLYMTFVGADKPSPSLFKEFDERMEKAGSVNRLYEGYGLTETVTVSFVNTFTDHKNGTVGRPLSGVSVRIVDPEDYAKERPTGQDGIILISGTCNCLGYLNVPPEEQPFYVDRTGKQWIKSGDIGHVDEEGYLVFKNRAKDSFKIAGYNVFPSDVEAFAEEVEGVNASAALFIDGPHPYIHLYIESHHAEDYALEEAVRKHLKDNLLPYSMPEKITVLPYFPRTAIGKIDRKTLIHLR